jgi:hypothetical protein
MAINYNQQVLMSKAFVSLELYVSSKREQEEQFVKEEANSDSSSC